MKPDENKHIGRYGTISLMKHNEPNTIVTAFGIDANQLTFGRDPSCGVRLYYDDVSVVHCKIVFEEYKAFLVVLGDGGLRVDDCMVYPNSSPGSSHTMVPLTNNSEFEIHGKRFRFTYPPKDLRPALYASPAPLRTPRLSMIQSTKVFAPRPSPDPRENLRVLKSPLKNTFKSPLKKELSTPLRANLFGGPKRAHNSPDNSEQPGQPSQEGNEEEDIVLVEGNHPRVVEEDKDLIILEDIEVPSQSQEAPAPLSFQTPVRRRSLSRNTLHRAVLIRSAQRAILKAEMDEQEKQQEQEEEMEVLDTVASNFESESDEEDEYHDEYPAEEDGMYEEDVTSMGDEVEEEQPSKLTWSKSLEKLWPFRSSSPERHTGEIASATNDDGVDDEEGEVAPGAAAQDGGLEDAVTHFQQTPVRKTLGQFMTPQVHPRSKVAPVGVFRRPAEGHLAAQDTPKGAVRYSLGGEARRVVRSDPIWRVRDIVIPEPRSAAKPNVSQFEDPSGEPTISTSVSDSVLSMHSPSPRRMVSEEERQVIKERRRSALRDVESFFPGGVPGMGSPVKLRGWSPTKTPVAQRTDDLLSPRKIGESSKREEIKKAEDALDTRILFERMKDTVEDMKRRRSLATPSTPQGQRASFGLGAPSTSPSKIAPVVMMEVAEEDEEDEKEDQYEQTERVEEPLAFSLLSPSPIAGDGEALSRNEADVGYSSAVEPEIDDETPTQLEPAVSEGNNLAEDVNHMKSKSRSKTPSRRTKAEVNDTVKVDQPPMPSGRRGRKVVDQPESSEPVAHAASQVPIRSRRQAATTGSRATPDTAPRRGRKLGTDDPDVVKEGISAEEGQKSTTPIADEGGATEEVPRETVAPKRGSRKPTEGTTEPPPRRGRLPKVAAAAVISTQEASAIKASDDVLPAGNSRRTVRAKTAEQADPLDTIAGEEEAAMAKSKGRKKTVQQDKADSKLDSAPATTVAMKTRTKATGVKATDPKTRVRKTPATAPPAVQQDVNKENTPGSEVSSNPDVEEPVKVRVSRTTKKAASGTAATKSTRVKRDESEDEIEKEAPRGRLMRATRARTRT